MRFEVFKRDNFTCRYCGKSSPEVILEIDHVDPKSNGGTNDPLNLVTSCWECNRGKGSIPLDRVMVAEDPHERAIMESERLRQVQEYNRVLKRVRAWNAKQARELARFWVDVIGAYVSDEVKLMSDLRSILNKYPPELVKTAMEIASAQDRIRLDYTVGVLKNLVKQGSPDA